MSSLKPPGDVDRLPKWAQSYIQTLEMHLFETQEALDGDRNGYHGTDTIAADSVHGDRTLRPGARVRFNLYDTPRNQYPHEYIEVRREGDSIVVHGGNLLHIHPTAGNACTITVRMDR